MGGTPLAYSSSDSQHPVLNTSAWSISDGNGHYKVDIDMDVVGVQRDVGENDLGNRPRSGSVRVRSATTTSESRLEVFQQLEVRSSAHGGFILVGPERPISAGSPSTHRKVTMKAIKAFDGDFPLDEVDSTLIQDRSAPHIQGSTAVHFAIRTFDKHRFLRKVPDVKSGNNTTIGSSAARPRSASPIAVPSKTRLVPLKFEPGTLRSRSGSLPPREWSDGEAVRPPDLDAYAMSPQVTLSGADEEIVAKLKGLPALSKMTSSAHSALYRVPTFEVNDNT